MAAAAERELRGPFPTHPGSHIINEFLEHVRNTGQPDVWRFHEPSKPPRDQDFHVVLPSFQIPDKLRPDVGKASCPICSPEAPKYFEGALAWFPDEGVLRAIGHECASSHFGVARHNAAVAAGRRRRAVESAQDFLLEELPNINSYREAAEALEPVARDIDKLRQAFWSRSSKAACQQLVRAGRGGVLTIEEHKEVAAVDAFGKDKRKLESRTVATFAVSGLNFLNPKFSVLGQARNGVLLLSQVEAVEDEESALQFVCDVLSKDEFLFEAEKIARKALDDLEKLQAQIDEAAAFVSPNNLAALSAWSRDPRAGASVQFDFSDRFPRFVRVRCPGKTWHEVRFPDTLRAY